MAVDKIVYVSHAIIIDQRVIGEAKATWDDLVWPCEGRNKNGEWTGVLRVDIQV